MKKKEKNITVIDIANYLNLSPSTVSRALNNNPKISQKTKEKVWQAAKELGYSPNLPAYLVNTVGKSLVVLVNKRDYIFQQSLNYLLDSLRKYGLEALVWYIDSTLSSEQIEVMRELNVAGIIMSLYDSLDEKIVETVSQVNKPIFTLNKKQGLDAKVRILIDYYYAGYLVISHLSNKAKNIGLIVEPQQKGEFIEELKAGINSAQIESEVSVHIIEYSKTEILERIEQFDAFIAISPTLACKVFCLLTHQRVDIPKQIKLISIDINDCLLHLPVGITSVEFLYKEGLEKFASEIKGFIDNGQSEVTDLVIPAKLIIRSSTLNL